MVKMSSHPNANSNSGSSTMSFNEQKAYFAERAHISHAMIKHPTEYYLPIIERAQERYMKLPGVTGVGFGRYKHNMEPYVSVLVYDETVCILDTEFGGLPIELRVTGKIIAL